MQNENDTTWVSIATLVVLAGVASGLFFINRPLESRRPTEGATMSEPVSGDELVLARLWQDPLHAMQSHWHALTTYVEEQRSVPLSVALPQTIATVQDNKFAARLVVMMPGMPYVEDRENRRRQRHTGVPGLPENDDWTPGRAWARWRGCAAAICRRRTGRRFRRTD